MAYLRLKLTRLLCAAALGVVALGSVVSAALAAEDRVDLIVDRTGRGIEVFFGMPATVAISRFGLAAEQLEGSDGGVDFAAFSEGTWDIGDALLKGVDVRIAGVEAGFEATSLMVHLKDQRLPFRSPLDALTAISVCGVAPPDTPPALDDLYLYAGFVAYPQDTAGNLRFVLPNRPGDTLLVQVRQFGAGHAGAARVMQIKSGASLVIGPRNARAVWWGAAVLSISLCVLAAARLSRRG